MPTKPIPDGYPRLSPYLAVTGAAEAIDFYTSVLGARLRMRLDGPDGTIGHAELEFGDALLMLSDAFPEMGGVPSPPTLGGTTSTMVLYVADVDAVFAAAVAAGATALRPVENQFYGDRSGHLLDPFGHRWQIATHVEDVSPEEMARRAAAAMAGA